jgi:hypothetical protein
MQNWQELDTDIVRIAARLTPDEMLRDDLAQEMRIRVWQAPDSPGMATRYEPVFHLPLIGRNWAAESYAFSLRGRIVEMEDADAVLAAWLYPDGVAAAPSTRMPWVRARPESGASPSFFRMVRNSRTRK